MSEFVEYNCDTNPYPSFGKKYNDEKAVISLTSWKKRINSVDKTIYSLLKQCPGFHIVLVLSEEEFPKMIDELPDNLMLLVENNLIELIFVYKNYKSFKKVLFTMDKYRDIPVISADDGCIYVKHYAEILYNKWKKHQRNIIVCKYYPDSVAPGGGGGYGIIYPPYCFLDKGIKCIKNNINTLLKNPNDDRFIACLAKILNIKIIPLNKNNEFITFVNINDCQKYAKMKYISGESNNPAFLKMIKTTLRLF